MTLNLNTGKHSATFPYDSDSATFGQFKEYLAQVTLIPKQEILVKFGHPPQVLDYADDVLLANTPVLQSGFQVTVAKKPISSAHSISQHHNRSSGTCSYSVARWYNPANSSSDALTGNMESSSFVFHNENTISVPLGDGYLIKRKVPGDNSCLFNSLINSLGRSDLTTYSLRALVSQTILNHPETYNDAMLNKPAPEYCAWIMKPSSWGGGIEMAIISAEFGIEICSIDTRFQRIDRFGEGIYQRRVFLLYSGSHYDYIAFALQPEAPREFDQTVFSVYSADADLVLAAALELAVKG
ncbi:ubiquitin-specific protease otu1 [Coemansia brasiliensis]|uniref:Ubiquitin thioesterase OTU n=1 Tax=Coemansia brasiliensis TaxID=2650707 RepID=A0A9W8M0W0_9FUNG|nr:ubiquitin-specific protease otu1 [Coemansia brasiliensis]